MSLRTSRDVMREQADFEGKTGICRKERRENGPPSVANGEKRRFLRSAVPFGFTQGSGSGRNDKGFEIALPSPDLTLLYTSVSLYFCIG